MLYTHQLVQDKFNLWSDISNVSHQICSGLHHLGRHVSTGITTIIQFQVVSNLEVLYQRQ